MTIVAVTIVATPVSPTPPGSNSDEDSIYEVIRSPVAVRRARVRRVIIVAVIANRRAVPITTVITPAYPNPYRNLCVRIARREHANRQ
jgi:hypothetical protein